MQVRVWPAVHAVEQLEQKVGSRKRRHHKERVMHAFLTVRCPEGGVTLWGGGMQGCFLRRASRTQQLTLALLEL